MLDGAARIGELIGKAVSDGQPALAITDHGNMYGVLDFYLACKNAGIKPIIGMEAYMAASSRHDRPARRGRVDDEGSFSNKGEKLYHHLTLLAENLQGYKNLMKLSSAAYLEGYYYKPRVDWELLERYHEGLIATTGCLGGLVPQALLLSDYGSAYEIAGRFTEIFGRDSFFIEIQDHGIEAQRKINPDLLTLSSKLDIPLLATNDSHYVSRKDAQIHDALLCVQTGTTISDPKRFRFEGEEHYLKSAAEMRHLFADIPEACDNTLAVAERVQLEIEFQGAVLPRFPIPPQYEGDSYEAKARAYLDSLAFEGAKARYGDTLPQEVRDRLSYELSVIGEMGFATYFLVVWDLIAYAKRRGIRVGPGRGSAAGSLVAYCLGIVELDPIRYDLLFERFLNPGRKQMPDIDMDFDERYRAEMIRYAAERYGSDHVAQIVTFSTIKARAAVRDAARVLGEPYALGDRIAKAMPPLVMGRDTPLEACLEEKDGYEDGYRQAAELRAMYETDPKVKAVVDVARGLEGLRRQDGIHAAAVVITDEPLTEYLPVQRKPEPGKDPSEAPLVTQYEMHGVELLGLLKMDFLGLRNLSVIEAALDLIEEGSGNRPDIDNIPLDDEETFAMLRRGESIGVFQLEGAQMRSLMRQLAPSCFDDIAALVALYRPGPMAANMHRDYAERKNGRQKVTYLHPDLEPILSDTYGLMIYQESVMRVAQRFAGYSLEEADNLRKACGKKIRSLIQAEREKFVEGCKREGYGEELGTKLFDIIEPFADYAFNKSHSYGYGLIAYQTAWLKAHYPVEYMAALLSSVGDDKDKVALYLAECKAMGIEVKVPDVNTSNAFFSVKEENGKKAITFGLSAVRNVGEGLVSHIVSERTQNGPYRDFYDFCQRVDTSVLNKRTVESLIKAGAFDKMGHSRQGLYLSFEKVIEQVLAERKERASGIVSLFAGLEEEVQDGGSGYDRLGVEIPQQEWGDRERLTYEKEMLGLYVSSHPLSSLKAELSAQIDCSIAELIEEGLNASTSEVWAGGQGKGVYTLGGIVNGLNKRYTKQGAQMASFILSDLTSSIEVVVFPKVMESAGHLLAEDEAICVKGRLDARDDRAVFIAMDITPLKASAEQPMELRVTLPLRGMKEDSLDALASILKEHPGSVPVYLQAGERVWKLPPSFSVELRPGLMGEIRELLGAGALS